MGELGEGCGVLERLKRVRVVGELAGNGRYGGFDRLNGGRTSACRQVCCDVLFRCDDKGMAGGRLQLAIPGPQRFR